MKHFPCSLKEILLVDLVGDTYPFTSARPSLPAKGIIRQKFLINGSGERDRVQILDPANLRTNKMKSSDHGSKGRIKEILLWSWSRKIFYFRVDKHPSTIGLHNWKSNFISRLAHLRRISFAVVPLGQTFTTLWGNNRRKEEGNWNKPWHFKSHSQIQFQHGKPYFHPQRQGCHVGWNSQGRGICFEFCQNYPITSVKPCKATLNSQLGWSALH